VKDLRLITRVSEGSYKSIKNTPSGKFDAFDVVDEGKGVPGRFADTTSLYAKLASLPPPRYSYIIRVSEPISCARLQFDPPRSRNKVSEHLYVTAYCDDFLFPRLVHCRVKYRNLCCNMSNCQCHRPVYLLSGHTQTQTHTAPAQTLEREACISLCPSITTVYPGP
jgi:hypothetical protein